MKSTPSVDISGQPASPRVVSIDVFRGLTMLVMIFVNELAGVRDLPWWTYHAPTRVDVMTYVDMVFPFFLFIVGMAMPISVTQRLKRDPSMPALWRHIIVRAAALIVIGLVLANADAADPALIHMRSSTWALIALVGAALYLNVYPASERHRKLFLSLRVLGLIMVIAMYVIFRRTTPAGAIGWIDFSYPEILGLIGFGYFATALLYIPTRRIAWAPIAWFVGLTLFCALTAAKIIDFPNHLPIYVWPFENGSMPMIIMAGILTSSIYLGPHWPDVKKKLLAATAFAVICLMAGRLLTPLGISKNRATPTWCLYSIAASILCFAALYWICDIRKLTAWASFVRPAGSNALLTYLLPDLWSFLFAFLGIGWLNWHFTAGTPGVIKTVLFTAAILALSTLLTRAKLRLQL